MKKTFFIFTVLLSFSLAQVAMASQTIKLGVVTKPGSAQNIVAEKFKERSMIIAGNFMRNLRIA